MVSKEIVADVPETAGRVPAREADLLDAIRAEDFSLEEIVRRFYS